MGVFQITCVALHSRRFLHRDLLSRLQVVEYIGGGGLSKLIIRIKLDGELARMFSFLKEANQIETEGEPLQILFGEDIKCFETSVEIAISEKIYQQISRLIRDFALDYLSVEEFIKETLQNEISRLYLREKNRFRVSSKRPLFYG